jgi:hypothetical protein
MAVTKKKDPMIEAIEKKRGRPAGTRVKHRQTVESVRQEWEERFQALDKEFMNFAYSARQTHENIAKELNSAKITVLDQYAIIRYLESKVEQLIANSIRGN